MEGFDLSLTGCSDIELASFLTPRTEGLTDTDEAPAVPDNPVTCPGYVWIMGRH